MAEIESIRDLLGGRDLEIYDSAFEEGVAQERARKDAQIVSDFADVVMAHLHENDVSPEEAVEKVVALKNYRDLVLEEVSKRIAETRSH